MSELTHQELKEALDLIGRDHSFSNAGIPVLGKLYDMLYDAFAETSANTDKVVKLLVTTNKVATPARFSVHHAKTRFFFDGKRREAGFYLVSGSVFLPKKYTSRRQAEAVRSKLNEGKES